METLNVYLLGKLAGFLNSEKGTLSFRYIEDYLQDPSAIPLSFTLPLQKDPFDNQTTSVFFDNLLPPEVVRKRLDKILHLSRHNIFGFLKAIGGDCAGAVSLHPVKTDETVCVNPPSLRELTNEEAVEILTQLPKRPLNLGREDGFRISVTGAQDKLIACIKDNKIFLPLYGEPSTHIIKPPISDYPNSVFNEFFCMRLAEKLGFPAPHCNVMHFDNIPYYCVTRYDRKKNNSKVSRLHQEDFCQLLSVDAEKKYENEGGPTIPQCFKLIKKMHVGVAGQLDFLRRIIFNYLIGNGDAHAKNFSVRYSGKNTKLAPVYDLLCTEIYSNLSRELAMSIGKEFSFDNISRNNFQDMAVDCQIRPEIVFTQIDDLLKKIIPAAESLKNELAINHPCPVYDEIIQIIKLNVKRLS